MRGDTFLVLISSATKFETQIIPYNRVRFYGSTLSQDFNIFSSLINNFVSYLFQELKMFFEFTHIELNRGFSRSEII